MGKYAGRHPYPTPNQIAQFAYSVYMSRGRQDGHDNEGWLHAEEELEGYYV
jgi:Protein of unknown function (DUF2934)